MKGRWFRFYDEALNDPKVQRLAPDLFKAWVNLLCLASEHKGYLPELADIAFALRCPEARAAGIVARLVTAKLIDHDGQRLKPHNWSTRQYENDSSAERTKRWRERKRDAAGDGHCDVTVTSPDIETEAETETHTRAVAAATRGVRDDFERFWKVYPRREGANPREPAWRAFSKAVAGGCDPEIIVAAALSYAQAERERVGTRFIAQAVRWLSERRFADYPAAPERAPVSTVWFHHEDPRYVEWDRYLTATRGKGAPTDGKGGWHFPTERPPDDARPVSVEKQAPLPFGPVRAVG